MEHWLPETPEGLFVATVVLFALLYQARSALLLLGIPVNHAVYVFGLLSFLLFFVLFGTVSLAVGVEPSRRTREI